MSFTSFADSFAMYDATPVENIFILEFMPYAPDEYVRCYLYALMLCHHPSAQLTMESMAQTLHMSEKKVLEAFRYWEQKGLVVGTSDNPPTFQFVSARNAVMEHTQEDDDSYRYRDYVNELQSIMGLLHPNQFQTAMEWVEELRIPEKVVLEAVRIRWEMEKAKNGGKPRSVLYMMKVYNNMMLDWAEKDIRTMEKARTELARELPAFKLAQKVLSGFNLRRDPTEPEVDLCEKWLHDWNYDEKGVLARMKETVKAQNPSFAYLDAVLENQRGAQGEAREESFERVKEVLAALGGGRAPTDDLIEKYGAWRKDGFEHSVLLKACTMCSDRNKHSVEDLERVLQKWSETGLKTEEAVARYVETRSALRREANTVFDLCGISRRPADADLDMLSEWKDKQPMDVILFAAQCARGTVMPLKYIEKSITEWTNAHVSDVEGAKRERAARPAPKSAKKADQNENPALQYTQRTHEEHEFDDLFVDLSGEN